MRIVNRKEFLSLPNGIVYAKYQSLGVFSELHIKSDTWENDWIYQDLMEIDCDSSDDYVHIMDCAENDSNYRFKLDLDCTRRDGGFDEDEMFVVFEKEDAEQLLDRLNQVVREYPVI